MKKFVPKTDAQLLDELSNHLSKCEKIVAALRIRESMTIITCKEGKKKRKR